MNFFNMGTMGFHGGEGWNAWPQPCVSVPPRLPVNRSPWNPMIPMLNNLTVLHVSL